ncbi:MAG: hypothetical protein DRP11_00225 [Candidatus Aenigmatarchaeota archaeon]|nr:MAG: hypothetical protein DRP11_00225 [Candidatus Aenigmarchaeota archaeon]
MAHNLKITFLIILLFLPVSVLGFGSTQKDYKADIYSGQSVEFEILLYSLNKETTMMFKTVSHPEGWRVWIIPEKVNLPAATFNSEPEIGKEYLKVNEGYVEVKKVLVKIETPWDTITGDYLVRIEAVENKQSSNGVSAVNVRDFNFFIRVKGLPLQEKTTSSKINHTAVNKTVLIRTTHEKKKEFERWWLPPLLIIILLLLVLFRRA